MLAIRSCWGAIVGLLLVVYSSGARAQGDHSLKSSAAVTDTLRGVVKDSLSGQPLDRTQVVLFRDTIGPRETWVSPVAPVNTDKAGAFLIPDVPVGSYILQVGRVGHIRRRFAIHVARNTQPTLVVRMTPAPVRLDERVCTPPWWWPGHCRGDQ